MVNFLFQKYFLFFICMPLFFQLLALTNGSRDGYDSSFDSIVLIDLTKCVTT